MKYLLPNELWSLIYSFDNTYHIIYNRCINDLKFMFMKIIICFKMICII